MGTNLYVGNVSYNSTEADLRAVFEQVGRVTRCNVVMDRETGRARGFAFVEMGSDAEAAKAIAEVNGQELDGRPLVVNEARPREDRPRGPRSEGGFDRPPRRDYR